MTQSPHWGPMEMVWRDLQRAVHTWMNVSPICNCIHPSLGNLVIHLLQADSSWNTMRYIPLCSYVPCINISISGLKKKKKSSVFMIIIIDLVTSIQHTDQNICNQSNLLFCSVQCEFFSPLPGWSSHHPLLVVYTTPQRDQSLLTAFSAEGFGQLHIKPETVRLIVG